MKVAFIERIDRLLHIYISLKSVNDHSIKTKKKNELTGNVGAVTICPLASRLSCSRQQEFNVYEWLIHTVDRSSTTKVGTQNPN